MKKLNTKAFTVIELIITFSVVMTISLGLFKVVDTYREKQQQESYKKMINSYISEIVKPVKEDILRLYINKIEETSLCTGYKKGVKLYFKDGSDKLLCVEPEPISGDNGIKYGDIFYKLPSKFMSFVDDSILETNDDTTEKPIYNKIKKDAVDENKITVPVITEETHYTIDIKLKHSELDKLFNITISSSTRKIENKEERLSDDINSPSHYIKKVKYSKYDLTEKTIKGKYIDEYEIIFNGSNSEVKYIAQNTIIENSVINTIKLPLKANTSLQTYLKNNKVNEVLIPDAKIGCSDVTDKKDPATCSTYLQTGYVDDDPDTDEEQKIKEPLFNFNNMNKFTANDFTDTNINDKGKTYSFYTIRFVINGYIKSLDLRKFNQKHDNIYNVFIPYDGIKIGNIYVSNLEYDSIDKIKNFSDVSSENVMMHALLAGCFFYGIGGTKNFVQILDVQASRPNNDKINPKGIGGITNLVIDPEDEGELVNLPTAIKTKVTNLVLSSKVTSVSDPLKSSGLKSFGIKTLRYYSDSLDGVSFEGFNCNYKLNKCTYTG